MVPPPHPAQRGGACAVNSERSGEFPQGEFISPEDFNALGPHIGCLHPMGTADEDVKSILETLEKDCGAVRR